MICGNQFIIAALCVANGSNKQEVFINNIILK